MASRINARLVLMIGGVIGLGLVAVVAAQAPQPAPRTQMDELLTEVRAIRADLDRAAAASLRGQLLGMRLQLQEQRITALSRQLSEVQQRQRDNAQAKSSMAGSLKMLLGNMKEGDPNAQEQEAMKTFLGPLKAQLAALDRADAELKTEESNLMSQLNDEQSRWAAFNAQVEELERSTNKAIR